MCVYVCVCVCVCVCSCHVFVSVYVCVCVCVCLIASNFSFQIRGLNIYIIQKQNGLHKKKNRIGKLDLSDDLIVKSEPRNIDDLSVVVSGSV